MTKPIDADLVAAFKADLSAAWDRIREQYPSERLYAFGLYTTEAARASVRSHAETTGFIAWPKSTSAKNTARTWTRPWQD